MNERKKWVICQNKRKNLSQSKANLNAIWEKGNNFLKISDDL